MKANMVKRDKSARKLIPDIASKKRSKEFLVQEVKIAMRNLQSTLNTDAKHISDNEVKADWKNESDWTDWKFINTDWKNGKPIKDGS